MIDQVAAAFDRQDYKTAAQLLKQLQKQSPDQPWVKFYYGRLQEVSGKIEAAATIYRQLLRDTSNSRLVAQAREGLQRLEANAKQQRKQAIAQAMSDPANAGLGFLILEPIAAEAKQAAAQRFAQIMQLDPYTARLHLPSRGWRLYRVGTVGELQVYQEELQKSEIPVFCVSLAAVQKIRVFRAQYLQSVSPQVTVVCQNELGQAGSLTFDWAEVTTRVEGLLPIFEDVVDVGLNNKLTRKEQTQDYAHLIDLHLPKRNCILRFCDRSYQFQQGVIFDASQDGELSVAQVTTRIRWNRFSSFLSDRLSAMPATSDFTIFGETALEYMSLIKDFAAHIDLFRKAPSHWDSAFQLYSGLVFERSLQGKSGKGSSDLN